MSALPTQDFAPSGYNHCIVILYFTNTAQAIEFYVAVLDAKEIRRFESADKTRVLHAELRFGDTVIMLGDHQSTSDGSTPPPVNAGFYHYVPDVDKVYSAAIKNGAKSKTAPNDAFYGERVASFDDPFGNHWSIAKRLPKVQTKSDDAMATEVQAKAEADAGSAESDSSRRMSCCSTTHTSPSTSATDECKDEKCVFDEATANADLVRWKKMSQIHYSKVSDRKPKQIVSESEWHSRHGQHNLLIEKALTHHKDYLSWMRQQLPWTEFRSDYIFEDIHGKKVPFLDLFSNPIHDDLIIYNMMFPNSREKDECCSMCGSWVDNFNGNLRVLQQKTNIAIIARGSPSLLSDFSKCRGWSSNLPLFSSGQSTFHFDQGYSLSDAEYNEFKQLIDENNGNGELALKKLREINPKHPNVTVGFGVGMPYLFPNRSGTLVLHLDRKTKKIYKH